MIAMIGTSDRLCWLAETCKILLLLLHLPVARIPTGQFLRILLLILLGIRTWSIFQH